MILNLKYDPQAVIELFIKDLIGSLGIPYRKISAYEIQLDLQTNKEQVSLISEFLANFNIEINRDHKEQLVLKVKELVGRMIVEGSSENTADYLSRHLDYSYRYISNTFQETTYCSIENFVIFQKVEYVKKLATEENLSLTEIAYKLDYSSVAHLSRQFKKTTGLTFQEFQKILGERNRRQVGPQQLKTK